MTEKIYLIGFALTWAYLIAYGHSVDTEAFVAAVLFGWSASFVWPVVVSAFIMSHTLF